MTTTATAPACPKCGGAVWDQMGSKFWGTGLFKSGKQKPRWECKNKECGGAIWDKASAPAASPPKSAPAKQPISYSSAADKDLPPELRNVPEEETRELAAKLAGVDAYGKALKQAAGIPVPVDLKRLQADLAIYQGITEWYLDTIVPVLTKADVGCSPESVTAGIATIFIQAKK